MTSLSTEGKGGKENGGGSNCMNLRKKKEKKRDTHFTNMAPTICLPSLLHVTHRRITTKEPKGGKTPRFPELVQDGKKGRPLMALRRGGGTTVRKAPLHNEAQRSPNIAEGGAG